MDKRLRDLLPQPSDIQGRGSSITYAIAASATPYVEPSAEELDAMLRILDMDRENIRCAFCGQATNQLGHLHSLVENGRPTGWGTTIGNLIPACARCKSSRGNKPWEEWIERKVADPTWPGQAGAIERIKRIALLEQRFPGRKLDWSQVPPDLVREFAELQAEAERILELLHETGRKIKALYNQNR
jgi:hypothetical protein